jgi:carboxylesterase type B
VTQQATAPRFDAPAGTVTGWRSDGVVRATGIRYARVERFAPPVPERPADGVVAAGREVRRVSAGFARTGEAAPAPRLQVGGG